jgi:flagellar motor protein MotB
MKLVGIISTAVLSLALGVAVPAFTQDHEQDEPKAKPAQDEKKAEPAKPAKQDEKNAQQQDKNKQQEEKSAQQQGKNNQQEQKNAEQQPRNNQQEEKNAQQQHAQPEQHANGNGGRIPDDRYKANFGREHTFRVSQSDYSSHRFQYGGYWFGFAGVWPSNWLYTQDVFVVDINGVYYLCNPMYPGVNIALAVTL